MNTTSKEPLGHHEERLWPSDPSAYPRKARRGGKYRVFIPKKIAALEFELDGRAVAAIAEAARALQQLNDRPPRLATLAALARNLLRSESAASSRIEGVAVSHKRLARAAFRGGNVRRQDRRAAEVLGNVEAMERAIEIGSTVAPFVVESIHEIHRTLLRFTEDRDVAGVVRDGQNWIGGNDYNPVGAAYVPPPPELVTPLLVDLCDLIARDDLAPVAQAAVAHGQFENIHPYADGNGRTGRALIYAILRRRGEIASYIPPISLVLGSEMKAYVSGLGAYSSGNVSSWCELFADATARAAHAADRLADAIERRQADWLARLGQPRKDAAIRQIISALPAQPVIDVATGQRLTGKSHVTVGNAIRQLEEAGILRKLAERKWGRTWECDDLLDLVEQVERGVVTRGTGEAVGR